MKHLYAGYFAGEFGWELMAWQSRVRYLAQGYDKVTIGCLRGHEFLYEDFAEDFIYWEGSVRTKNMWMVNQKDTPISWETVKGQTVGHVTPTKMFCLEPQREKWHAYGAYNRENPVSKSIPGSSKRIYQ